MFDEFFAYFWHQPESGRVPDKSPTTLSYVDFLGYPFWKGNHFEPYQFHTDWNSTTNKKPPGRDSLIVKPWKYSIILSVGVFRC